MGLGPPSLSPFPHTHRAPCSPVLLWQTSLGGTVRQCSCPCQGKQYLFPHPSQFLPAGSSAVQVSQGCCCKKQQQQHRSPTSPFPLQHAPKQPSVLREMQPGALQKFQKVAGGWGFFSFNTVGVQCYIYTNLEIQNGCTKIPTSFPIVVFYCHCPNDPRRTTCTSTATEVLPALPHLHSKVQFCPTREKILNVDCSAL